MAWQLVAFAGIQSLQDVYGAHSYPIQLALNLIKFFLINYLGTCHDIIGQVGYALACIRKHL